MPPPPPPPPHPHTLFCLPRAVSSYRSAVRRVGAKHCFGFDLRDPTSMSSAFTVTSHPPPLFPADGTSSGTQLSLSGICRLLPYSALRHSSPHPPLSPGTSPRGSAQQAWWRAVKPETRDLITLSCTRLDLLCSASGGNFHLVNVGTLA